MLFNSVEFLVFLPLVFLAYWAIHPLTRTAAGLKTQNALLLVASYVFYGWWDWRFLSLIALSTGVDWWVGRRIHACRNASAHWLALSLVINLGLLGYFKYANFFIASWVDAWGRLGVNVETSTLNLILPVGISFYTFQTLSYTLDIYRGKMKPTDSLLDFAAFVSFFPQLVAGPIERASALLPQIQRPRTFDLRLAQSGLRLLLWGMFKKVVVADTCAPLVDNIFAHHEEYSGLTLIFGAVLFAFQIYGDFSGYSDMAIGTGRLFGIRLNTNFATPYFSRNIAEFWRRWHISLSTWFKDYVYIPLGGSRHGMAQTVRNTFVIFLVSGFWHGANWTFVAWGGLHALLFLPLLWKGQNRKHTAAPVQESGFPSWRDLTGMATTFSMVVVAWVFFRAESLDHATSYLARWGQGGLKLNTFSAAACLWIAVMMAWEWLIHIPAFRTWFTSPRRGMVLLRWSAYSCCAWFVVKHFHNQADFIYFQF